MIKHRSKKFENIHVPNKTNHSKMWKTIYKETKRKIVFPSIHHRLTLFPLSLLSWFAILRKYFLYLFVDSSPYYAMWWYNFLIFLSFLFFFFFFFISPSQKLSVVIAFTIRYIERKKNLIQFRGFSSHFSIFFPLFSSLLISLVGWMHLIAF